MKIETTRMEGLWISIVTIAVLYLVMQTIQTLKRISKNVNSTVEHIGAEVDSAISRMSKGVDGVMQNLEKNAFSYRNRLFEHVQAVELQCYRSKTRIAFGFGPRTVKKKSSSLPVQSALQMHNPNTTADITHSAEPDKHQLLSLKKYKWPFAHHRQRASITRQQQYQETQSPTPVVS